MRLYEITSSSGEELPDMIYHATTLPHLKSIMKYGLDPDSTFDAGDYNAGFTFFAWTLEGAEEFAPGTGYSSNDIGVILGVSPPPEIARQIRTDLGEFIRCPVMIPPKYIKVIKYTNV